MQYLIQGRIVPERVDFNIPQIALALNDEKGVVFHCSIEVIRSLIFIHVNAEQEINIMNIRNGIFDAIGDLVNLIGFKLVLGISYELDSITSLDEKWTHVFGVEGCVFDSSGKFRNNLRFNKARSELVDIKSEYLQIPALSRATFELRNSIRYPSFTALHCRLAIESIRNHFDSRNEKLGWSKLRESLNVNRETIESFQFAANLQRHGRNIPQSWEQRREAMQIAWEICYRFQIWLLANPPARLSEEFFPQF